MILDNVPGRPEVRSLIFMAQQVSDGRYLALRDFRGERLEIDGYVPAGLGNYLQPAFDGALHAPIVGKHLESAISDHAFDTDYRVTHIRQTKQDGASHVRRP